jgi:hypothetical protein
VTIGFSSPDENVMVPDAFRDSGAVPTGKAGAAIWLFHCISLGTFLFVLTFFFPSTDTQLRGVRPKSNDVALEGAAQGEVS